MRRRVVSLVCALVVLGTSLAVPAAAAVTVTNGCVVSVPEPGTATPVRICYSLFEPAGASGAHTVPLIFHSHGWGGSRTKDPAAFQAWLDAGFGVLSFDQRSFGESTGVAHVMNPDYEGRDVVKLVDFVAGLDWVTKQRPGDPLIGAIGGSYGGGYQFAGAFTELRDTGRTRFDALAPHTLPSVVPPGFATPGDPCSMALGSPNFSDLAVRFMTAKLLGKATGLSGFGVYHLSTADGRCLTQRSLAPNTRQALGKILVPTGAGLPLNLKIATGPLTVAGTPHLSAKVYTLVPDSGAFFALSVSTNPLTARVVQNNTMPLREKHVAKGVERTIELPAIALDVPAGKNLYLTVTPVADMYAGQRGPLPGALLLKNVTLTYRTLSR